MDTRQKLKCAHDARELILFHYGELDEQARTDIEMRLTTCVSCAMYIDSLKSLEEIIPRAPSVHLSDNVLSVIRTATHRRISSMAREGNRTGWSVFRPSGDPLWPRLAIGAGLVILGFFIGKLSLEPVGAVSDTGIVVHDASTVSRVSDITYDPQNGIINVEYSSSDASRISGTFEDASVRSLLEYALVDGDYPAGRLRATRVLAELHEQSVAPDPDIVRALGGILSDESNEGLVLMAVKALRSIRSSGPLGSDITTRLVELLRTADNSALRMESMQLLTESELARQDLTRALQNATEDRNSFIRFRAQSALESLGETQPLEAVK